MFGALGVFAAALLCKSLAEHDSVTASEFCNSMFSVLVYTNDIFGLRRAGDFSLWEPEKFPGKLKTIAKHDRDPGFLLWGMWFRGQAGGGLSPLPVFLLQNTEKMITSLKLGCVCYW